MRWDAGRKATSSSKYLQVYFPAGFFLGGHLDIFFFLFRCGVYVSLFLHLKLLAIIKPIKSHH